MIKKNSKIFSITLTFKLKKKQTQVSGSRMDYIRERYKVVNIIREWEYLWIYKWLGRWRIGDSIP